MSNMVKRYLWFLAGILINSFGVAFITKAALGTSQISSVPYVLSLKYTGFSFGAWTFVFNMLFILIQVILLKKDFKPVQYLQIAVNVIFSWFIDFSMGLLSFLNPSGLLTKLLCLLAGCAILAIGISIEVAPNVLVVPGEGVVKALTKVTGKRFGTTKVLFDVTLIVLATILSLAFFGRLNGIGLGTVVSALLIGRLVNLCDKRFPLIAKLRAIE